MALGQPSRSSRVNRGVGIVGGRYTALKARNHRLQAGYLLPLPLPLLLQNVEDAIGHTIRSGSNLHAEHATVHFPTGSNVLTPPDPSVCYNFTHPTARSYVKFYAKGYFHLTFRFM